MGETSTIRLSELSLADVVCMGSKVLQTIIIQFFFFWLKSGIQSLMLLINISKDLVGVVYDVLAVDGASIWIISCEALVVVFNVFWVVVW